MNKQFALIMLAALAAGTVMAQDAIKAARGTRRFTDIAALPVTDPGAQVHYEGSIDPAGFNADYTWGTYQDKHGDWVLMETDKPGCLFNFVQHRHVLNVETPTFKFYFEGEDEPRFTITAPEFGLEELKPPFLRPLCGRQYWNHKNDDEKFSIIRAFCPMEFIKGCKVTSTVALRGYNVKSGGGGWGHIMYHTYPDADGLKTFDPKADFSEIARLYREPLSAGFDAEAKMPAAPLGPGERRVVYKASERGTITDIELTLSGFRLDPGSEGKRPVFDEPLLTNVWVELSFDGVKRVEAPFGTFYGSQIAYITKTLEWRGTGEDDSAGTNGNMRTSLVTFDISGKDGFFSNRFPMPFWESAEVAVVNRGATPANLGEVCVRTNSRLVYDRKTTGYFTAAPYEPLKRDVGHRNVFLGQLVGRGQLVYSAFAGIGIGGGKASCEGDVRIFLDSNSAPAVLSDGTESWGCWGMGFWHAPRLNPFSFYLTRGNPPKQWSLMRETIADCCYFEHFMRFELEHFDHGLDPTKERANVHYAGQVFAYLLERP